jgi:RNA polymerase sporulation-specific sigma factor
MLRRLLSDFEWKVLAGYQIGKSYQEIAEELSCRPKSIDNALARIKRKINEARALDPSLIIDL